MKDNKILGGIEMVKQNQQVKKQVEVVADQVVEEVKVVPEPTEIGIVYEASATEKVKAFGKKHWKKIAGVAGGLAIGATVLLLKKDSDDGFDGEIIEGHFEELANTVSDTVQNVTEAVVETVEEIGE